MSQDDLHPLIKTGVFHHQFVSMHPFLDCNGRLTRILTEYYLLLKNYEVAKYFILDDYYDMDRHLYSDKLHTADQGDKTTWL
ncbi:MAG: Fic family protein [Candidatus Levybacteria bacterium]|nr:Fic family protein [Candidatus Levybacteria bacterium]